MSAPKTGHFSLCVVAFGAGKGYDQHERRVPHEVFCFCRQLHGTACCRRILANGQAFIAVPIFGMNSPQLAEKSSSVGLPYLA